MAIFSWGRSSTERSAFGSISSLMGNFTALYPIEHSDTAKQLRLLKIAATRCRSNGSLGDQCSAGGLMEKLSRSE